jgi:hypothetical protein
LSQKHPRAQLAAITAGLAAAALLAGPAATWALDVTGVTGSAGSATTQVTGAAQGAVDTTQQTVATTVTNVESTAQTTVQTTTQATQPVVNQVQASAPAAPAAPAPKPATQPTSRPATGTKSVARHTAGAAHAVRSTAGTSAARSLRPSVAAPARTPARHLVRLSAARHSSSASTPTPQAASPVAPQCDSGGLVQVLNPLLAVAPPVGALLTAVCDAGNSLLGPAQTGPGREAVLPFASPAQALAALAAGVARANARGAGLVRRRGPDPYPVRASGAADPLGGTASQTRLATTAGNAVAFGRGGSFVSPVPAIAGSRAAGADPSAPRGAGHNNKGLFGTSISGTEVVFAILVLDWAIVVALVMWRVARRRPVLRYAIAWRARRERVAPSSPGRLAALFSIVR